MSISIFAHDLHTIDPHHHGTVHIAGHTATPPALPGGRCAVNAANPRRQEPAALQPRARCPCHPGSPERLLGISLRVAIGTTNQHENLCWRRRLEGECPHEPQTVAQTFLSVPACCQVLISVCHFFKLSHCCLTLQSC